MSKNTFKTYVNGSLITAEDLNLIINNLETMIEKTGQTPSATITNQLQQAFKTLTSNTLSIDVGDVSNIRFKSGIEVSTLMPNSVFTFINKIERSGTVNVIAGGQTSSVAFPEDGVPAGKLLKMVYDGTRFTLITTPQFLTDAQIQLLQTLSDKIDLLGEELAKPLPSYSGLDSVETSINDSMNVVQAKLSAYIERYDPPSRADLTALLDKLNEVKALQDASPTLRDMSVTTVNDLTNLILGTESDINKINVICGKNVNIDMLESEFDAVSYYDETFQYLSYEYNISALSFKDALKPVYTVSYDDALTDNYVRVVKDSNGIRVTYGKSLKQSMTDNIDRMATVLDSYSASSTPELGAIDTAINDMNFTYDNELISLEVIDAFKAEVQSRIDAHNDLQALYETKDLEINTLLDNVDAYRNDYLTKRNTIQSIDYGYGETQNDLMAQQAVLAQIANRITLIDINMNSIKSATPIDTATLTTINISWDGTRYTTSQKINTDSKYVFNITSLGPWEANLEASIVDVDNVTTKLVGIKQGRYVVESISYRMYMTIGTEDELKYVLDVLAPFKSSISNAQYDLGYLSTKLIDLMDYSNSSDIINTYKENVKWWLETMNSTMASIKTDVMAVRDYQVSVPLPQSTIDLVESFRTKLETAKNNYDTLYSTLNTLKARIADIEADNAYLSGTSMKDRKDKRLDWITGLLIDPHSLSMRAVPGDAVYEYHPPLGKSFLIGQHLASYEGITSNAITAMITRGTSIIDTYKNYYYGVDMGTPNDYSVTMSYDYVEKPLNSITGFSSTIDRNVYQLCSPTKHRNHSKVVCKGLTESISANGDVAYSSATRIIFGNSAIYYGNVLDSMVAYPFAEEDGLQMARRHLMHTSYKSTYGAHVTNIEAYKGQCAPRALDPDNDSKEFFNVFTKAEFIASTTIVIYSEKSVSLNALRTDRVIYIPEGGRVTGVMVTSEVGQRFYEIEPQVLKDNACYYIQDDTFIQYVRPQSDLSHPPTSENFGLFELFKESDYYIAKAYNPIDITKTSHVIIGCSDMVAPVGGVMNVRFEYTMISGGVTTVYGNNLSCTYEMSHTVWVLALGTNTFTAISMYPNFDWKGTDLNMLAHYDDYLVSARNQKYSESWGIAGTMTHSYLDVAGFLTMYPNSSEANHTILRNKARAVINEDFGQPQLLAQFRTYPYSVDIIKDFRYEAGVVMWDYIAVVKRPTDMLKYYLTNAIGLMFEEMHVESIALGAPADAITLSIYAGGIVHTFKSSLNTDE